jgi:hypothetical protein
MGTKYMGLIKVDRTLDMQIELQRKKKERMEEEKRIDEREKQTDNTRPFWNSSWQK